MGQPTRVDAAACAQKAQEPARTASKADARKTVAPELASRERPELAPILRGWRPGAIGRIAQLHGEYYARHWKFPAAFEALVARELAEFIDTYDAQRDGLWLLGDAPVNASISLVGPRGGEPARIRWFIADGSRRGQGAGARLMDAAMHFAHQAGYRHLYLTTFAGLDAARRLYEQHGFVLTHQQHGEHWGAGVDEQRFDWHAR